MGGAGSSSTSILAFGGISTSAETQSWNGSNWTNENSMSTGRAAIGGAGTITSALAFGGDTGSNTTATEEWDGDSLFVNTVATD